MFRAALYEALHLVSRRQDLFFEAIEEALENMMQSIKDVTGEKVFLCIIAEGGKYSPNPMGDVKYLGERLRELIKMEFEEIAEVTDVKDGVTKKVEFGTVEVKHPRKRQLGSTTPSVNKYRKIKPQA